jgi:hypothetical protein
MISGLDPDRGAVAGIYVDGWLHSSRTPITGDLVEPRNRSDVASCEWRLAS